jgi:hypothetical protein
VSPSETDLKRVETRLFQIEISPFNPPSNHSTSQSGHSMDYASVIFSPMLSFPLFSLRQLPLRAEHLGSLSPFLALKVFSTLLFSDDCRLFARSFSLLPLFFDVVLFVFSNLQTLFAKQGGWGVPLP